MPYKFREQKLAYNKKYKQRCKKEVIEAYGNKCVCCGETTFEFLSIDHINDNGREHRKTFKIASGTDTYVWLRKHGFPKDEYQLLCMNCNFSKARYGYCPHKNKEERVLVIPNQFAKLVS